LQSHQPFSGNNNNSIQFFIYLSTEINSQWPITESAKLQTTAVREHKDKTSKKNVGNWSAKVEIIILIIIIIIIIRV
jgi:hypothetical protein